MSRLASEGELLAGRSEQGAAGEQAVAGEAGGVASAQVQEDTSVDVTEARNATVDVRAGLYDPVLYFNGGGSQAAAMGAATKQNGVESNLQILTGQDRRGRIWVVFWDQYPRITARCPARPSRRTRLTFTSSSTSANA